MAISTKKYGYKYQGVSYEHGFWGEYLRAWDAQDMN